MDAVPNTKLTTNSFLRQDWFSSNNSRLKVTSASECYIRAWTDFNATFYVWSFVWLQFANSFFIKKVGYWRLCSIMSFPWQLSILPTSFPTFCTSGHPEASLFSSLAHTHYIYKHNPRVLHVDTSNCAISQLCHLRRQINSQLKWFFVCKHSETGCVLISQVNDRAVTAPLNALSLKIY